MLLSSRLMLNMKISFKIETGREAHSGILLSLGPVNTLSFFSGLALLLTLRRRPSALMGFFPFARLRVFLGWTLRLFVLFARGISMTGEVCLALTATSNSSSVFGSA